MSGKGELRLEHWIYGVSHEKGYGVRAESHDLNASLYTPFFGNLFTPVRMDKTQGGETGIDTRMVHPVAGNDEILFSLLGRGEPDEYDRPTIQNHTVVVPGEPLRSGRLSFEGIEGAVQAFDRSFPKAAGRIDPITISPGAWARPPGPVGTGIRRFMSQAAAETLATHLLTEPGGRVLVLCRQSTSQYRNTLLYRLIELLNFGGNLELFPAISDAPTLSAMNHFRLAISARGVRADRTWTLLDAGLDAPALPRYKGKTPMYSQIAEAFAA